MSDRKRPHPAAKSRALAGALSVMSMVAGIGYMAATRKAATVVTTASSSVSSQTTAGTAQTADTVASAAVPAAPAAVAHTSSHGS